LRNTIWCRSYEKFVACVMDPCPIFACCHPETALI
jgi:hypothetical protein